MTHAEIANGPYSQVDEHIHSLSSSSVVLQEHLGSVLTCYQMQVLCWAPALQDSQLFDQHHPIAHNHPLSAGTCPSTLACTSFLFYSLHMPEDMSYGTSLSGSSLSHLSMLLQMPEDTPHPCHTHTLECFAFIACTHTLADLCMPPCGYAGQKKPGVSSFLQPCGFQELNSGCRAWQRVPLPTERLTHPRGCSSEGRIIFHCMYISHFFFDSSVKGSSRPEHGTGDRLFSSTLTSLL